MAEPYAPTIWEPILALRRLCPHPSAIGVGCRGGGYLGRSRLSLALLPRVVCSLSSRLLLRSTQTLGGIFQRVPSSKRAARFSFEAKGSYPAKDHFPQADRAHPRGVRSARRSALRRSRRSGKVPSERTTREEAQSREKCGDSACCALESWTLGWPFGGSPARDSHFWE